MCPSFRSKFAPEGRKRLQESALGPVCKSCLSDILVGTRVSVAMAWPAGPYAAPFDQSGLFERVTRTHKHTHTHKHTYTHTYALTLTHGPALFDFLLRYHYVTFYVTITLQLRYAITLYYVIFTYCYYVMQMTHGNNVITLLRYYKPTRPVITLS